MVYIPSFIESWISVWMINNGRLKLYIIKIQDLFWGLHNLLAFKQVRLGRMLHGFWCRGSPRGPVCANTGAHCLWVTGVKSHRSNSVLQRVYLWLCFCKIRLLAKTCEALNPTASVMSCPWTMICTWIKQSCVPIMWHKLCHIIFTNQAVFIRVFCCIKHHAPGGAHHKQIGVECCNDLTQVPETKGKTFDQIEAELNAWSPSLL